MSPVDPTLASVEVARHELAFRPLVAASEGSRWTSVAVEECSGYAIHELHEQALDHHVIGLPLEDTPFLHQERCGKRFEGPLRAGQTTIIPAGRRARWRGRFPAFIALRLSSDQLADAVAELRPIASPRVDLANCFAVRGPELYHLGQLLNLELRRRAHPTQGLLIQSLAVALSVHLLRQHSNAVGIEGKPGMSIHVAAIRRALAYINDQPDRAISLDELAAVSGLSRFHFSREFKRHVGAAPVSYVERSRIERAKELIRTAQLPLVEVALAVGFADQSHFTRRFRHHVGCTPAAFAREHARGRLPSHSR